MPSVISPSDLTLATPKNQTESTPALSAPHLGVFDSVHFLLFYHAMTKKDTKMNIINKRTREEGQGFHKAHIKKFPNISKLSMTKTKKFLCADFTA